jgi:exosortase N
MLLNLSLKNVGSLNKSGGLIVIVSLTYLFLAHTVLSGYFQWNLTLMLGIALIPYIFIVRDRNEYSNRFLWMAIFFGLCSLLAPLKTFYFFCWVFAFLFLIESILGKLNLPAPFLLLILSPAFSYLSSIAGIPARLMLTEIVSKFLSLAGYQAEAAGNLIMLNGNEFSIDPGCMGLSMFSNSIILALFILVYFERQRGKIISFAHTAMAICVAVLLNLVANLSRILILVIFNIGPENPLHDLAGIIALLVYVLLPFFWLSSLLYKKYSYAFAAQNKSISKLNLRVFLNILLVCFLIFTGYNLLGKFAQELVPEKCFIPGYSKTVLDNGVVQFENKQALIYVKPALSYYQADHSPMICWTNNGYVFKKISRQLVKGREIYLAKLVKGSDIIYASWWFDNGKTKTISQINWRWLTIKGENDFSVINVNSDNEATLLAETAKLLQGNIFGN